MVPMVILDDELKRLLIRVKVLGGYASLQEALEDSVSDFYYHILRLLNQEDK